MGSFDKIFGTSKTSSSSSSSSGVKTNSSGEFKDDGATRYPIAGNGLFGALAQRNRFLSQRSGRASTDLTSGTRPFVNTFLGGTN